MKILLVDDSRAIHSLIDEMFDGSGIALQHAYNGQEAVEALKAKVFDAELVLLDWEMPVLSGIEALPVLRQLKAHLPIVMMTSKSAMSDIVEALEKGATDYIMKPFTKDILIGRLNSIMNREVA